MNDEEKKLRRLREIADANAARKALNEGNGAKAISFLQETTEFYPLNLITIMSVLGFQCRNKTLRKQSLLLFHKYLRLCSNAKSLEPSALWLKNPKRSYTIGLKGLNLAIDERRRVLEPNWDGIWVNNGLEGSRRALSTFLGKNPNEVNDTETCLLAASQLGNWSPWVNRYRTLGGSFEDPRYLKILVSKAANQDGNPSRHQKFMLRKFTALADISEVRSFLRNITRTCRSAEGKMPHRDFAKYALYLYCECERLKHVIDDWVHISLSAMYLNHHTVERIVQRVLATLERSQEANEVYYQLIQRHGEIKVTHSVLHDIGLHTNPIWQSVYRLTPVNLDARRILAKYSRLELDSNQ